VDFNCEVGATQFTLHTFYAGLQILDSNTKAFQLKNLLWAKLYADIAPFTVFFNYLNV